MSVLLYDEAVVRKLNKVVKDNKLKVLSPDETERLYNIKSDENNDAPIQLPLIALSRNPSIDLQYAHKKPMSFDGLMLDANYDKSLQLDAIPMSLEYQLDIYTRYAKEGNDYLREFVFYLVNHSRIDVIIPYNDTQIQHDSFIHLLSTLEDTSDIPLRLVPGQFTRWTIRFRIDDAYFFSTPYKDNVHIGTILTYNDDEID